MGDDSLTHRGDDDAAVERARQQVEAAEAGVWPLSAPSDAASPLEPTLAVGEPGPTHTAEGSFAGYRILSEIHRGGQGVVYQAVQKSTKRKVAVKVLLEGPFASEAAKRRFEREIDLIAQLKHPNIITIFDSGTTADGRLFFAMDYVRGLPLRGYVRENKLTLEQTLKLFAQVCEAVQYAHQKGVIHRDLKPGNILVDSDGVPKVLDFGLAKQMANPIESVVSLTGHVVGTLPYMSPEQARGNPDHIDTRTDVYALGVVLYELLTGHYPYPVVGLIDEVLGHIKDTPPTPPSRAWRPDSGVGSHGQRKLRPGQCPIDHEVQTIVLKALAKERERRYQSAGGLAEDVAHYLAGQPIDARRDSGWYVLKKTLRRYRTHAVVAGIFALLVAGGAVALGIMYRMASRERDRAEAQARLAERASTEAMAERDAADSARADAERQRDLAEFRAYVANITAADAALNIHDVAGAQRRLADAPEHLRNWEWGYLTSQSDQSLVTLQGHTDDVLAVAFSPDGAYLASGSRDGTIRIWNPASAALVQSLTGHGSVTSIAWSPDGAWLASNGTDGTVKIWDVGQGVAIRSLTGALHSAMSVAFSPDGKRLAAGFHAGRVKVWETASGIELLSLPTEGAAVASIAFRPDGTRLAAGLFGGTVRVWDFESGAEVLALKGHRLSITSVCFNPDGRSLASASHDGTINVWDADRGEEFGTLSAGKGSILSVAFDADGKRLVAACRDGTIRLWAPASGEEIVTLHGHSHQVNSVAYSPDGCRIASASDDHTVRIWDARVTEGIAALRNEILSTLPPKDTQAMSPDGRFEALGTDGGVVAVHERPSGTIVRELCGHTGAIVATCFSPDGSRIASASEDATIAVWDVVSGAQQLILRGHSDRLTAMTFSPDGTRLASLSTDRTVRFWDALTGAELLTFPGAHGVQAVGALAFSEDGSCLVARGSTNALVWDSVPWRLRLEQRADARVKVPNGISPRPSEGHTDARGDQRRQVASSPPQNHTAAASAGMPIDPAASESSAQGAEANGDRTLDLRLVSIRDGLKDDDEAQGRPYFAAAESVGLDLPNPEHPLFAHIYRDGKLFYLFYKVVENAFGNRPYVIQRIRKTVRDYRSADDLSPQTTVTYQVEAFKTNAGTLKGADQHYGSFSLQDWYRREIVKEYEIGFGEVPGRCSGHEWPFKAGVLFRMIQPYAPETDIYEAVRFSSSRTWSLSVSFDREGGYSIRAPELGIDAPQQIPALEDVTPRPDPASAEVVLEEGRGTLGLLIGISTAVDVTARLGDPLEVVRPGGRAKNYSHDKALTFNIYDDGAINTIFTRPSFAGQTAKGIGHGDSRKRVQEVYGISPNSTPNATNWHYDDGVIFYFDGSDRVNRIVLCEPSR